MSVLLLLLTLTTNATELPELPERPGPHEPAPKDCETAIPLETGTALTCDSIAVPPSWVADYEADRAWAKAIYKRYQLDTALLLTQQDRCEWALEQTTKQYEKALSPTPIFQRPGTWFSIGVFGGTALAVATTYAVVGAK